MRRLNIAVFFLAGLVYGCSQKNSPSKQADAGLVKITVIETKRIARLTGKTLPGEKIPNTGYTTKYNVGGTDLGIMWDMEDGRVGLFFGDSYGNDFVPVGGGPGKATDWRFNLLGFSTDSDLSDGLTIDSMVADANGAAKQVLPPSENSHTIIPTAAIHVNGADYVHYFDLKSWKGWVTNFSSLYKSKNGGKSWERCNEVIFPRGSKFSVAAWAKKDGYVYMAGTRTLRTSPVYLCRFKEKDILYQKKYEYWNNLKGWVKGNEETASKLFDGPVGEASLFFNDHFNCWMLSYLNDKRRNIELSYAKHITGPWSAPEILVAGKSFPGLYGPFMYPHNKGDVLYFTMSVWAPYNVFLMKARLKQTEQQ